MPSEALALAPPERHPPEALQTALDTVASSRCLCQEIAARLTEPCGLDAVTELVEAAARLREDVARLGPALAAALGSERVVISPEDGRWRVTTEHPALPEPLAPVPPADPPPPAAPPPPRIAPSSSSLQRLAAQGLGAANVPAAPGSVDAAVFLRALTRPERVSRATALLERLESVEKLAARRAEFTVLEAPSRVALVTFLAAELRYLQERARELSPTLDGRIAQRFRELSGWCKAERPGFVHGLSLDHGPRSGSWLGDAQAAWDGLVGSPEEREHDAFADLQAALESGDREEVQRHVGPALEASASDEAYSRLVRMLAPHDELLKGQGRFKTLRKDLRAQLAREEAEEETLDRETPVPADGPWRALTEGKRVLALGGDRRSNATVRWSAAFGFAHVAWETGWNVRRVQSSVEAVLARRYDLVLLLRRFVSHKATDAVVAACKQAGVPFAVVDAGYGVAQVRRALEERLRA